MRHIPLLMHHDHSRPLAMLEMTNELADLFLDLGKRRVLTIEIGYSKTGDKKEELLEISICRVSQLKDLKPIAPTSKEMEYVSKRELTPDQIKDALRKADQTFDEIVASHKVALVTKCLNKECDGEMEKLSYRGIFGGRSGMKSYWSCDKCGEETDPEPPCQCVDHCIC